MYEDWQIKGWGKIVKTDEATGRFVFAPNEQGKEKIKKVYEDQLGYNKPIEKEDDSYLNDYVSDLYDKYGALLTDEERTKLGTKEKQVLIERVPEFEKFSDKDLTQITNLMELKQKKETDMEKFDGSFKKRLKGDINNIDLQIQEIVDKRNGKTEN